MTSISLKGSIYNNKIQPNKAFSAAKNQRANNYKEQGNEFLKYNDLDKAIECYKHAIELNPQFADAYFNLGKAYKFKKDYTAAIHAFEQAKKFNPNDYETITVLGETYKQNGLYQKALQNFNEAIQKDSSSDYAKRNLEETKNLQFAIFNPQSAMLQKKEYAKKNLNDAIALARNYLPTDYLKDLSDVTIAFDTTSEMGGRANIAQYEHAKRKITVTGDYVWANPRIVSAYLVHEFVHAKDNDPYTSIAEEQDAYEQAAKFWISKLPNDSVPPVKDPEMDYVGELYSESPMRLKSRVAEIYKLRDPHIAATSPNHPPMQNAAATSLSKDINAQSLKSYDVIA